MKRAIDSCSVNTLASVCFPREVWILVLQHIPFLALTRMYSVCTAWCGMVGEAVTRFDGNEDAIWLTNQDVIQYCNLQELRLGKKNSVTDKFISRLRHLTSLDLSFNRRITDCGIMGLTNLAKLKLLETCHITKAGLTLLTNLTDLNIEDSMEDTDDDYIRGWSQGELQNLRRLRLCHCPAIRDDDLSSLTSLTELEMTVSEEISDAGLLSLTNLTDLKLYLEAEEGEGNFTDNGIRGLVNLTSLELDLYDPFISDVGIRDLTNLTSLSLLGYCYISDSALARLTGLRTLHIGLVRRADPPLGLTIESVSPLTNLTSLSLTENYPGMGDRLRLLTNLTSLVLHSCTSMKDDDLTALLNLRNLELRWNSTGFSDAGVKMLSSLTRLRLNNNDDITADGLTGLANLSSLSLMENESFNQGIKLMTNLTSLELWYNTGITDDGITGLTRLNHFGLSGRKSPISNAGLKKLVNLTSLSLSDILPYEITEAITGDAVSTLTNLITLDLRRNTNIPSTCLRELNNLRFVNRDLTDYS